MSLPNARPLSLPLLGLIGALALGCSVAPPVAPVAPTTEVPATTRTGVPARTPIATLAPSSAAGTVPRPRDPSVAVAPAPATDGTITAPATTVKHSTRSSGTASAARTSTSVSTPLLTAAEDPTATDGTVTPLLTPVDFTPAALVAVRTFSPDAIVQVLDFDHVVVADGTLLAVSNDAGANWVLYHGVGATPIRAIHFFDTAEGWVAGDEGTLLHVTIAANNLSYAVNDPGTASRLLGLYFTSPTTGWYADEDADVVRTTADGVNWTSNTTLPAATGSSFKPDGLGGLIYLPTRIDGVNHYSNIYRQAAATFARIEITVGPETFSSFTRYATGGGTAYFRANQTDPARPATWFSTSDWLAFTSRTGNIQTATQLIRDGLDAIFPISATDLLGRTTEGKYCLTHDGGLLWSDPQDLGQTMEWVQPTSETQMWGYKDGVLYRTVLP